MPLSLDMSGQLSAGDGRNATHRTVNTKQVAASKKSECAIRKRMLDIVAGCICLAMLLPLLILVVIAIRIESRGPVIFRQTRTGYNGKTFQIYKLRTMKVLENGSDVRQVTLNDARITRIGRILRKTSIDELPQLVNVILGHMSLVGPRPHALAHDRLYGAEIDAYVERFAVRPGITGLAQVSGCRGETRELDDMRRRIAFDLAYIENWSLRLDLQILFLTARQVLRDQRAY